MGNQLCPGSAKDLIQQLGQIEKGEKSYQIFFKSCFQFKDNKLHEILVQDADDHLFLHLEQLQEASRPHFQRKFPQSSALILQNSSDDDPSYKNQKKDEVVQLDFGDGTRYKGQVRGGLPHGLGQEFTAHGDHYSGTFQQGVKSGRGVYIFQNGERYEGQFRENAMWGKGVYLFANGDIFEGEFVRNERSGTGKYRFGGKRQGLKEFQGRYRGDIRDGHGKLLYDGFQMAGQWKNGLYEFSIDPSLFK